MLQPIAHCAQYLLHAHPASVRFYSEQRYISIVEQLIAYLRAHAQVDAVLIPAESYLFDSEDLQNLESTLYVFIYDVFIRPQLSVKLPGYIEGLGQLMKAVGSRGLYRLFDVGDQFNEIFAIPPERIDELNQKIIECGKGCKTLQVTSTYGTTLSIDLATASHWTSYNGKAMGFPPGEVAFYPRDIKGEIHFTGALFSGMPIGLKHGLIRDPVILTIQEAKLQSFVCENELLEKDLKLFFGLNEGNKQIIEVGLGTNEGISTLYGRSAPFEERFCGLHLGFGGEAPGSLHCDFIFDQCSIYFDNQLIFDRGYRF